MIDERKKREILVQILTKEARERLGRIKLVKPELAEQIENQLIALYLQGRIKEKINDEKLKSLLRMLMK